MNELLDFLETRYTSSEIIELLKDFDEDKLGDYAIKNDVCILCGGELVIHRWEEEREFWGSIVKEPLSELKCCECGETF